jgi:peptidoglycan/LPS O-acetylase OafA/YrhL
MAIVPLAALGRRRGLGIGVSAWAAACLGYLVLGPGGEVPWFPKKWEIVLSIVNLPFLLGVLAYLTHRHWSQYRSVLIIAAVAFAAGRPLVQPANHWSYVLQSISGAILVGYLATNRQISAKHILVRAGDWAYGVYLAHVPVLMMAFSLVTIYAWPQPSTWLVAAIGLIALAGGVGYGMFEWACYQAVRNWMTGKTRAEGPRTLAFPTAPAATVHRQAA